MIENTLPNKSGNLESLKNLSLQLESSATNGQITGEDLLRALYKLFYSRFCVSSDPKKNALYQGFYKEFERHFYMKIVVTIIPTLLVTNSLLFLFCSFVETKKQQSTFQQVGCLVSRNISFFVYGESRSTSKVC